MRLMLFLIGIALISGDYFLKAGLPSVAGLALVLTAASSDAHRSDDWQTKYRPG